MRFKRLFLRGWIGVQRGLGCDEIEVDFTRFSPGLVALVGANGSGKSTVLENLTPYLQLASRSGALTNHVYLKDSRKELEFDWGNDKIKCVILLNAKDKSTQTFLYVNDTVQNDGKVNTYEEVVNRLFGSPKLFFHSVFSAQHRTPLTELTKGERKELFTELLGLSYLQEVSDVAKKTSDLHNDKLNLLTHELARKNTVEQELATLVERATGAESKQKERTSDQTRTNVVLTQEQEELEVADKLHHELDLKVRVAESRMKERERLDATCKTLWLERDAIQLELEQTSKLVEELPQLKEKYKYWQQVTDRIATLEEQERKCSEVGNRALALKHEHDVKRNKREIEVRATEVLLQTLSKQIRDDVPCLLQPELFNTCPLLANVRTARAQVVLLTAELQVLQQPDPEMASRVGEIERLWLEADTEELRKELTSLVHERRTLLNEQVSERFLRAQNASDRLNVLQPRLEDKNHQYEEASRLLEQTDVITTIDLVKQLGCAKSVVEAHTKSTRELRQLLQDIDRELVGLSTLLRELELQRSKLANELTRFEEKERVYDTTLVKRDSWLSISKAFGKDGIQAFELDAAGPKITHLANELLLSAFGSRFTISLETLRYNVSTKSYREVFDVVVHREDGTDQLVETLSGGERVWIETAIAEAIGVLNTLGRGGRGVYESVCADEIDGALDPDNKLRFLAMVEKSHVLGKRYHTFLVTQSETVSMSVAQRLVLGGGRIAYEC